MWWASSAGVSTSLSSTKSTPSACEDLGLDEVPDAGLGHHRDRDGGLDAIDHLGIAHPRHAAVTADVGRHPLERHDGAGPGVLGDARLLGRDDVHDDAALEHLGQAALDRERAGGARESECPMRSMLTIGSDDPAGGCATSSSPVANRDQPPRLSASRDVASVAGSASSTQVRPGFSSITAPLASNRAMPSSRRGAQPAAGDHLAAGEHDGVAAADGDRLGAAANRRSSAGTA